ncbi:MAG TPA: hypothetical protein P5279_07280 [Anaerohalosphaeraceae bacterium]|nr:hypothetical protein [Anaerohalosphaeraceae bacterium]HRT50277.1 hypothetical protein [Anaerohalosphaeraceae bacterium]HRT86202.1 hypothetical protein [Anaerohalosphaeraceae bacterium]
MGKLYRNISPFAGPNLTVASRRQSGLRRSVQSSKYEAAIARGFDVTGVLQYTLAGARTAARQQADSQKQKNGPAHSFQQGHACFAARPFSAY